MKFGPSGELVDAGITDNANGLINILPGPRPSGTVSLLMGNYGQLNVLLLRVYQALWTLGRD